MSGGDVERRERLGRGFEGYDVEAMVETARRNAVETLGPGIRYEIREAIPMAVGGLRAVGWVSNASWMLEPEWKPFQGRSFEVVTGVFLRERGTTPGEAMIGNIA